jgi:hypothetical protein
MKHRELEDVMPKFVRGLPLFASVLASLGLVSQPALYAGQVQPITYDNGAGTTVYGVTNYGGGAQINPAFIANNLTGNNDILSTPGGQFQLANPVIGNNIAETPVNVALPLLSFQIGGVNANGLFGAGATAISGPSIGFGLTDSGPGGGSASYMISSWTSNYTVGAQGFNGTLGSFLGIGGAFPDTSDAVAASLVSTYTIGNNAAVNAAPLILAAAGNGNFVADAGTGAALVFGPGDATYQGLAIDNFGAFNLDAGTNITVVTTVTAYADPASIDSFVFDPQLDASLLSDTGTALPGYVLSSDSAIAPTPEPATLGLVASGILGVLFRRRRSA